MLVIWDAIALIMMLQCGIARIDATVFEDFVIRGVISFLSIWVIFAYILYEFINQKVTYTAINQI